MSETKACIACSEDIRSSAKLCKHCNTRQDDENFREDPPKVKNVKTISEPTNSWSPAKSFFTRLAILPLVAFVLTGFSIYIVEIVNSFNEPGYLPVFNGLRIGVVVLVVVSIIFQFLGKGSLGFLLVVFSTIVDLTSVGMFNIFNVPWEYIFSGQMTPLAWIPLVSIFTLPMACVLLIVGRPEWKLLISTSSGTKASKESPRESGLVISVISVGLVILFGIIVANTPLAMLIDNQTNVNGSSDTNSQPQQVTYEPHERYYNWLEDNLFPKDGSEAMVFALDALNYYDPDGRWEEDSFSSESPVVAGVLLDTYSVFPAGCAIWWFDSKEDTNDAIETGAINFFSDSYHFWRWPDGPEMVLVANSYDDACFTNVLDVLELTWP